MTKQLATALLLIGIMLPAAHAQSSTHSGGGWESILDVDEPRQFDFWVGEWSVNNRFLQEDGSWIDGGSARVKIFPILDGKAILEFWDGRFGNGFVMRGFSLRYFDPSTEKWQLVLNWPGPNSPSFGELSGTFRHGRGDFFNRRTNADSVEVLQRFTFADITPVSLRWNNGTSTDDGKTWSTSWIMEFSRTADQPTWTPPGKPFHTYETGERCTADEATQFDFLEGRWEGTVTHHADGATEPAHLEAHRVLDGCAVFDLLTYGTGEDALDQFRLRSFIPNRGEWVEVLLDDRPDTGYVYQAGVFDGDTVELTGFVPAWYAGTPPETLRKTTWTRTGEEAVHVEVATSDDDGASWTMTQTVELEKR